MRKLEIIITLLGFFVMIGVLVKFLRRKKRHEIVVDFKDTINDLAKIFIKPLSIILMLVGGFWYWSLLLSQDSVTLVIAIPVILILISTFLYIMQDLHLGPIVSLIISYIFLLLCNLTHLLRGIEGLCNVALIVSGLAFLSQFAQDKDATFSIQKWCSNCGKEVSITSKAHEKCPHCGGYWSDEIAKYQ